MEQTHGTWGNRTRTFQNSSCLVTILELEPKQRCSWHFHKKMFNQFYVVSGMLGVRTEKGYTTKLTPGQQFTVEQDVRHEFITYHQPTVVQEIAYVKFDETDIYRERLGGATDATDESGRAESL